MSYHPDDTICAIGTAAGGAARGMVRVSGRDAAAIVAQCFEPTDAWSLDNQTQAGAAAGRIRIEFDSLQRSAPCDLYLWPTQRSYTREPVAELHTLGSRPLLDAVLAAVCHAGARLAEPGEFTLRAFLAGRLDLTQAEAVLGVIDAGGAAELEVALTQLAGGLARPLHDLRDNLLQLLAELEAGLDFVDEDIRFVAPDEVLQRLNAAGRLLDEVARQMASRHAAGPAQQVVLTGPPNVGKSSLFNALIKRLSTYDNSNLSQSTPALVSSQRGTTRDYLTAIISLGGIRCELVDTAGVETRLVVDITTPIDSTAQAHTAERRKRAAVRALCIAAPDVAASELDVSDCDILVLTKSDIATQLIRSADVLDSVPVVVTSSRTGEGLDELCNAVRTLLTRDSAPQRRQVVAATAERCSESIRLAASAVQTAAVMATKNAGDELVAMELRVALAELGKVVGAVYTDDLLDRIFKTFCIGK